MPGICCTFGSVLGFGTARGVCRLYCTACFTLFCLSQLLDANLCCQQQAANKASDAYI